MIKNSFFQNGNEIWQKSTKIAGWYFTNFIFEELVFLFRTKASDLEQKCQAKIYMQWRIWGANLEKVIVFRMLCILYKISYWFLILYKNNFQFILIIIIFRIIWILFIYINCFVFNIDQKITSYLDILNDKIPNFFTADQWNLVFQSINNYISFIIIFYIIYNISYI